MTEGVPTRHSLDNVRLHRPTMSTTMARVADLVLANPGDLLDLSITELAQRAGTSPATVTRFCHRLGYPGFAQFRVRLAADVGRDDVYESWRTDIGREFDPEHTPRQVLRTLVDAQQRALETTASLIDLDDVATIAQAVWESRHLDIYGIAGSGHMADELRARLYRIGVNAHAWTEVHDGLASAAILDEQCVAIGISNSGRTTETVEMLGLAKSAGAMTVAVTSDPASPLGRLADRCIANATPKRYLQPDDLAAKHAQLLVLDVLYLLVAQQDYASVAGRLAASRVAIGDHRTPLHRSRPRRRTR